MSKKQKHFLYRQKMEKIRHTYQVSVDNIFVSATMSDINFKVIFIEMSCRMSENFKYFVFLNILFVLNILKNKNLLSILYQGKLSEHKLRSHVIIQILEHQLRSHVIRLEHKLCSHFIRYRNTSYNLMLSETHIIRTLVTTSCYQIQILEHRLRSHVIS